MDFWRRMEGRGPDTVTVAGVCVGAGSRVRLRPRSRTDIFDLAMDGRVAIVEGVEQDDTGALHLAVTLEDDPGRDLGEAGLPGHRFFYSVQEVEPLEDDPGAPARPRVLVAGIGNVFLGDDGFGVEVARLLAERPPPPGVDVVDFGIRGMDLAYALQRGYDAVLFVDAAPRGVAPGTLTVLEAEPPGDGVTVDTHGMDPVKVLRLARELGRTPGRVLVLACEPATVPTGAPDEDVCVGLSSPVRAVLGQAAELALALVDDLLEGGERDEKDEDRGPADAGRGDGAGRTPVAGDRAVPQDDQDVGVFDA
ncbi:hydrogenase maturation protease [Microtetraspora sp. NBRC 13810]|uniref:hydrogenase maturation protease n=1 Tax=Microtetraspora sp. NBRC 13810 TaxID=3030990 RepID=UPI0025532F69|nr:hydrogenase maturation protease [Microtetraspora sp. NBRC 13810]